MPVALRAAADTNSGAGVALVNTKAAVPLPQAARKTPPPGATQPIPVNDPHPVITEFFGPAAKAKATVAPPKTIPQAQLQPVAPAK